MEYKKNNRINRYQIIKELIHESLDLEPKSDASLKIAQIITSYMSLTERREKFYSKKFFIHTPETSHLPYLFPLCRHTLERQRLGINSLKKLIEKDFQHIHDYFRCLKMLILTRTENRYTAKIYDFLIQDLVQDFIFSGLIPQQIIRKKFKEDELLFSQIKVSLHPYQVVKLRIILQTETIFDMLYEPEQLNEALDRCFKIKCNDFLINPNLYQKGILGGLICKKKALEHLVIAHSYMVNKKGAYKTYFTWLPSCLDAIISRRNEDHNQALGAINIQFCIEKINPNFTQELSEIIQAYLSDDKKIELTQEMITDLRKEHNHLIRFFIELLTKRFTNEAGEKFKKKDLTSILNKLIANKLLSHDTLSLKKSSDNNLLELTSIADKTRLIKKSYVCSEEEKSIVPGIENYINNYFEEFLNFSEKTKRLIENLIRLHYENPEKLNSEPDKYPNSYLSTALRRLRLAEEKRKRDSFIPQLYDLLIAEITTAIQKNFSQKNLKKIRLNTRLTSTHALCDQFLELSAKGQQKKYPDSEALINAQKLLDQEAKILYLKSGDQTIKKPSPIEGSKGFFANLYHFFSNKTNSNDNNPSRPRGDSGTPDSKSEKGKPSPLMRKKNLSVTTASSQTPIQLLPSGFPHK